MISDFPYGIVGVAGDWHCDTGWAGVSVETFSEYGIKYILHLGDFGFWPGNSGQKFLYKTNKRLVQNDQYLFVTLGNHEDYVQLSRFQPYPDMPGFVYNPDFPRIIVASRGARWSWDGTSFVSLGGANSIDFTARTEWVNWWRAERITMEDIRKTVEGGHADVMLTHDCPEGVALFGTHRKQDPIWAPIELRYANESRKALRMAVDGVKPQLLMHGHFHFFTDDHTLLNDGTSDYELHSIGLDMNGTRKNLAMLDLKTLDVEIIPISLSALKYYNQKMR